MRPLPPALGLAIATLLAVPGGAAGQSQPFQATGEVFFLGYGGVGNGASYSDDRIVGQNVNLTRRDDGGWAGDLLGQNVDMVVTPERLSAPNFDVHIERKGDRLAVRGNVFGQRFSVEMTPKELTGRSGSCSFDLSRIQPGVFRGNVGCMSPRASLPSTGTGLLKLAGDASQREPALPQLALALIAALG